MSNQYSDGVFYHNNTRVNPFLVNNINTLIPGTAIDFGCGIGTNASYLKDIGWNVYLIEREDIALATINKSFSNDKVYHQDITKIVFKDLPICDLILCNYVMQHLTIDEAKVFIQNAISILSPNGHLIFSIFEREACIGFSTLVSVMEEQECSLLACKHWSRLDVDHGPAHYHNGVESFWKKG